MFEGRERRMSVIPWSCLAVHATWRCAVVEIWWCYAVEMKRWENLVWTINKGWKVTVPMGTKSPVCAQVGKSDWKWKVRKIKYLWKYKCGREHDLQSCRKFPCGLYLGQIMQRLYVYLVTVIHKKNKKKINIYFP